MFKCPEGLNNVQIRNGSTMIIKIHKVKFNSPSFVSIPKRDLLRAHDVSITTLQ